MMTKRPDIKTGGDDSKNWSTIRQIGGPAMMTQKNWSRSGLGAPGSGEGFGYCASGTVWPKSDCMRPEDACLPSASNCVTSAAQPAAA